MRLAIDTPAGSVALAIQQSDHSIIVDVLHGNPVEIESWLPALLGLDFTPPDFSLPPFNAPPRLQAIARKYTGMRIIRLPAIALRVVQIILQQLISYRDACHGWRKLTQKHGQAVTGHDDLWLPPPVATLRRLVSHQFIELGIPPKHGQRIVEAMRYAKRIDDKWASEDDPIAAADQVSDFLFKLPGIGPWTVGFLRGAGLGDADAEVLADYSHPKHVAYFFAGATTKVEDTARAADDETMLRLLEPYRPHRFYILSLLLQGSPSLPRRGPRRRSIRDRMR